MWRIRTVLSGWSGAPGLNTFYFQEPVSQALPADALAVLGRVRTFWNSMAPHFPAAMTAQVSGVIDTVDPANGNITYQDAYTQPAVVTGSSATFFLPTQVMLLMKMGTSSFIGGRRVVGRSFIGPVGRRLNESIQPDPVVTSALQAAGNTMKGTVGSYEQVIWHRPTYTGTRPNRVLATPGSVYPVTTVTVGLKYATLNSRRD